MACAIWLKYILRCKENLGFGKMILVFFTTFCFCPSKYTENIQRHICIKQYVKYYYSLSIIYLYNTNQFKILIKHWEFSKSHKLYVDICVYTFLIRSKYMSACCVNGRLAHIRFILIITMQPRAFYWFLYLFIN